MAMEVEEEQLGFPYWKPISRRFNTDSPFFASGNIERELLAKQVRFPFPLFFSIFIFFKVIFDVFLYVVRFA